MLLKEITDQFSGKQLCQIGSINISAAAKHKQITEFPVLRNPRKSNAETET
jgi:hypothetical protein